MDSVTAAAASTVVSGLVLNILFLAKSVLYFYGAGLVQSLTIEKQKYLSNEISEFPINMSL